ncbi:MAG: hypothetical protein HY721_26210 [Planctomycetes bacterium]|nr:hypothetical protein [Planctomycetota bacterium]
MRDSRLQVLRLFLLAGLLLSLAHGTGAEAEEARGQARARRVIYNSDGTNVFIHKPPPMRPEDVWPYVDEVAGTDVTTFFICPNAGQNMYYPGRAADMLGSHVTPEQAERIRRVAPATPVTIERAAANVQALAAAGHDPIGLVVERARAKGLEVFITFRLNEVHDVDVPDSLLLSRFWKEHPEWRVGGPGWNGQALDFSVPEVRARRLEELRECCERFAIDGLDLDFQRFPSYFPPDRGPERAEVLTAWVREVRAMTRDAASRRGRPLLLSARVLATPEACRTAGLDPAAWGREGLVDFVTASHFLHNDFPLPVAEHRRLLPTGLSLYASIEVEPSADAYRRIALRLWADGADGLMLFNFFTSREERPPAEPPFEVLRELGGPERIDAGRYVEISADELEDKVRGGMLAQVIGNLNGLPHEMRYIDEPGSVESYAPGLPEGARTDDDTDLEWVYAAEMERSGELFLPPERIAALTRT